MITGLSHKNLRWRLCVSNPQYTLTVALGVGNEGLKRRETYEKAANGKPLGQWVREVLDEAAKKAKK